MLADAMTRLGTESVFDMLARATALQEAGRDILHLSIGQPDFRTAPHIVEAAVKALRDGHHGYTPTLGIRPLREAIVADIAARRGVTIDPGQVLTVPGGKVTMFFAILMFGQPGAEILYPNPGFPVYESMIRYTGATPVAMPLVEENGFSFDADAVLARIGPATRLIILNSPANPTGGVVPRAQLDRLVAGLVRHPQVHILSDEIYGRLLYDGAEHVSLLGYPEIRDRVILLDGFSKTYAMTGWRLGYGVWPKHLIEPATRLAINCHSCVNAAAQYAGVAALNGPQDTVDTMLAAFAERRGVVMEELATLPGVRCRAPGGAFYAFANITGTGYTSKALEQALLEEAGVATVAGTSFGAGGEGFLRLSYAADIPTIRTSIGRMRDFLKTYHAVS